MSTLRFLLRIILLVWIVSGLVLAFSPQAMADMRVKKLRAESLLIPPISGAYDQHDGRKRGGITCSASKYQKHHLVCRERGDIVSIHVGETGRTYYIQKPRPGYSFAVDNSGDN